MTRFFATFMLLSLCLFVTSCASNALARENLKRAWEVREQDKRPVLPDAIYMALPPAQRFYFLPQSLDDAAHFERDQALKLAE